VPRRRRYYLPTCPCRTSAFDEKFLQ
jgi:hypothetical protein